MFDTENSLSAVAEAVGGELNRLGWVIGTAESCTGGLLAAAITDIAGSSQWFAEGVVTYSNESKQKLLGVSKGLIEGHGAVSGQVVEAMVAGVLSSGADVAIATSGIAGPGGGTEDKPVGTVWMAWAVGGVIESEKLCFEGGRSEVRFAACRHVLSRLHDKLSLEA